jgi:hypothetical protein
LLTLSGLLLSANLARAADATLYDSPEAAVSALLAATQGDDREALTKVLGSTVDELDSGDAIQDRNDRQEFARALAEAHSLDKNDDGTMTLHIGFENFPFPIPLHPKDGKWFFDTAVGKEEIVNRRVGENELRTIAVCRAYVQAQREYSQRDWDNDGVLEYAQKFRSTEGQKDGLYWPTAADESPSPMGPLVAQARAVGYMQQTGKTGENADKAAASPEPAKTDAAKENSGKDDASRPRGSRPYYGYVYKQLHSQGGSTPGGKFDYVINGNQVAGFAMAAYPVNYGDSGVMTFIVNANGTVWQKDLGEKTSEVMGTLESCDIDDGWTVVGDERSSAADSTN